MRYLLDLIYLVALLLLSPWLFWKIVTTGKYRRGLLAKLLGRVAIPARSQRPRAWFHGVSVGEVHLLRQIVAAFRQRHPDWDCVISTTTDTGFDEARKAFPNLPVFFYPLDFSWAVRRALCTVAPDLIILAESELWPNFLLAARARNSPVAVVNSRFSPRSARRHQRFRWLSRILWRSIDLVAVQTQDHADNLARIGLPGEKVVVTGNVKYDGVQPERQAERIEQFRRLFNIRPGDRVWVCGSTQAPEEQIALEIYRRLKEDFSGLRLILVPRQRERFDEVAGLLGRSGLPFVRRSTMTGPVADPDAIILVDTFGELEAIWGLAEVAFVGGSLDGKRGGQNMIQPAAFGAAVLFGPHVWNFRDAVRGLLAAGGAIQVADATELERAVRELLSDGERRQRLGESARRFVREQQGATARTMTAIDDLLHRRALPGRKVA
jgi:3-deoxy-D-manno-octulosonic-acid transferase